MGHKLALSILAVSTKMSIILFAIYKNYNNNLLKKTYCYLIYSSCWDL